MTSDPGADLWTRALRLAALEVGWERASLAHARLVVRRMIAAAERRREQRPWAPPRVVLRRRASATRHALALLRDRVWVAVLRTMLLAKGVRD